MPTGSRSRRTASISTAVPFEVGSSTDDGARIVIHFAETLDGNHLPPADTFGCAVNLGATTTPSVTVSADDTTLAEGEDIGDGAATFDAPDLVTISASSTSVVAARPSWLSSLMAIRSLEKPRLKRFRGEDRGERIVPPETPEGRRSACRHKPPDQAPRQLP